MNRNLLAFKSNYSFSTKIRIIIWSLIQNIFMISRFMPSRLKIAIARFFGAKIGKSVYLRRGVRIHFPWNLEIGDNVWIGEEVWIINHVPIVIGSNVCISQSAIICSSGHDFRTESLEYKHKEIIIREGAWVCLRANILAGSHVGVNSVVSAGETFSGNLPDGHIYIKNQIKAIKG